MHLSIWDQPPVGLAGPLTQAKKGSLPSRAIRKVPARDHSLPLSLTAAMADLTRKLPLELLAEILGHTSAPDILRFKLVSGDHQWVDR